MTLAIEFGSDSANTEEIAAHLRDCDAAFVPPLSGRTDIDDYARKITSQACRFEAWAGRKLVGLAAIYCNAPDKNLAFVTSVSVLPAWQGKGIASRLLEKGIAHVCTLGFTYIELEVDERNQPAVRLYESHGFKVAQANGALLRMRRSGLHSKLKAGKGIP